MAVKNILQASYLSGTCGIDNKAPLPYWETNQYLPISGSQLVDLVDGDRFMSAFTLPSGYYTAIDIILPTGNFSGLMRFYVDPSWSYDDKIVAVFPTNTLIYSTHSMPFSDSAYFDRQDVNETVMSWYQDDGVFGHFEERVVDIDSGSHPLLYSALYYSPIDFPSYVIAQSREDQSIRNLVSDQQITNIADAFRIKVRSTSVSGLTIDNTSLLQLTQAQIIADYTNATIDKKHITSDIDIWCTESGTSLYSLGHFEGRAYLFDPGEDILGTWDEFVTWSGTTDATLPVFSESSIRQLIPREAIERYGDGFRLKLQGGSANVPFNHISFGIMDHYWNITTTISSCAVPNIGYPIYRWFQYSNNTGYFEGRSVNFDWGSPVIPVDDYVTGIPASGHGYQVGDVIKVYGTDHYNGDYYTVLYGTTENIINIAKFYVAETLVSGALSRQRMSVGAYGELTDVHLGSRVAFSDGSFALVSSIAGNGTLNGSVHLSSSKTTTTISGIYNVTSAGEHLSTSITTDTYSTVDFLDVSKLHQMHHLNFSTPSGIFNFSVSFDNRNTFKVYRDDTWTPIVCQISGVWSYSTTTGWVASPDNNYLYALQKAMVIPDNAMSIAELSGLSVAQWTQWPDAFHHDVNYIDFGIAATGDGGIDVGSFTTSGWGRSPNSIISPIVLEVEQLESGTILAGTEVYTDWFNYDIVPDTDYLAIIDLDVHTGNCYGSTWSGTDYFVVDGSTYDFQTVTSYTMYSGFNYICGFETRQSDTSIIACSGNGLVSGDYIHIYGTDNYDGSFVLVSGTDSDTLVFSHRHYIESVVTGAHARQRLSVGAASDVPTVQSGMLIYIPEGDYYLWHNGVWQNVHQEEQEAVIELLSIDNSEDYGVQISYTTSSGQLKIGYMSGVTQDSFGISMSPGADDYECSNPSTTVLASTSAYFTTVSGEIIIDLGSAKSVNKYGFTWPTFGNRPADFTFEASNNGSTWVVLDDRYTSSFPMWFVCPNFKYYRYYKLNVTDTAGGLELMVPTFKLVERLPAVVPSAIWAVTNNVSINTSSWFKINSVVVDDRSTTDSKVYHLCSTGGDQWWVYNGGWQLAITPSGSLYSYWTGSGWSSSSGIVDTLELALGYSVNRMTSDTLEALTSNEWGSLVGPTTTGLQFIHGFQSGYDEITSLSGYRFNIAYSYGSTTPIPITWSGNNSLTIGSDEEATSDYMYTWIYPDRDYFIIFDIGSSNGYCSENTTGPGYFYRNNYNGYNVSNTVGHTWVPSGTVLLSEFEERYTESVLIPASGHGLITGEPIHIRGTSYYDGFYSVGSVTTVSSVAIHATYRDTVFTPSSKIGVISQFGTKFIAGQAGLRVRFADETEYTILDDDVSYPDGLYRCHMELDDSHGAANVVAFYGTMATDETHEGLSRSKFQGQDTSDMLFMKPVTPHGPRNRIQYNIDLDEVLYPNYVDFDYPGGKNLDRYRFWLIDTCIATTSGGDTALNGFPNGWEVYGSDDEVLWDLLGSEDVTPWGNATTLVQFDFEGEIDRWEDTGPTRSGTTVTVEYYEAPTMISGCVVEFTNQSSIVSHGNEALKIGGMDTYNLKQYLATGSGNWNVDWAYYNYRVLHQGAPSNPHSWKISFDLNKPADTYGVMTVFEFNTMFAFSLIFDPYEVGPTGEWHTGRIYTEDQLRNFTLNIVPDQWYTMEFERTPTLFTVRLINLGVVETVLQVDSSDMLFAGTEITWSDDIDMNLFIPFDVFWSAQKEAYYILHGWSNAWPSWLYPLAQFHGAVVPHMYFDNLKIEEPGPSALERVDGWTPWFTIDVDDVKTYEHYRFLFTENDQTTHNYIGINHIQLVGPLTTVVSGSFVSVTSNISSFDTTAVTRIINVEVDDYQINDTELYHAVSLDGKQTWQIYDATLSGWAPILTTNAGIYYYRNGTDFISYSGYDLFEALNRAMSIPANRFTTSGLAAVDEFIWADVFVPLRGSIDFAQWFRGTDTKSPRLFNYHVNYLETVQTQTIYMDLTNNFNSLDRAVASGIIWYNDAGGTEGHFESPECSIPYGTSITGTLNIISALEYFPLSASYSGMGGYSIRHWIQNDESWTELINTGGTQFRLVLEAGEEDVVLDRVSFTYYPNPMSYYMYYPSVSGIYRTNYKPENVNLRWVYFSATDHAGYLTSDPIPIPSGTMPFEYDAYRVAFTLSGHGLLPYNNITLPGTSYYDPDYPLFWVEEESDEDTIVIWSSYNGPEEWIDIGMEVVLNPEHTTLATVSGVLIGSYLQFADGTEARIAQHYDGEQYTIPDHDSSDVVGVYYVSVVSGTLTTFCNLDDVFYGGYNPYTWGMVNFMTSNTTPTPFVVTSYDYGADAYKVFDGDESTYVSSVEAGDWIRLDVAYYADYGETINKFRINRSYYGPSYVEVAGSHSSSSGYQTIGSAYLPQASGWSDWLFCYNAINYKYYQIKFMTIHAHPSDKTQQRVYEVEYVAYVPGTQNSTASGTHIATTASGFGLENKGLAYNTTALFSPLWQQYSNDLKYLLSFDDMKTWAFYDTSVWHTVVSGTTSGWVCGGSSYETLEGAFLAASTSGYPQTSSELQTANFNATNGITWWEESPIHVAYFFENTVMDERPPMSESVTVSGLADMADGVVSPIEITFNDGETGCTIPAYGEIRSDYVSFTLKLHTETYLIIMDLNSATSVIPYTTDAGWSYCQPASATTDLRVVDWDLGIQSGEPYRAIMSQIELTNATSSGTDSVCIEIGEHGLAEGDHIHVYNTNNYNGIWTILFGTTNTSVCIDAPLVEETVYSGSYRKLLDIRGNDLNIWPSMSFNTVSGSDIILWAAIPSDTPSGIMLEDGLNTGVVLSTHAVMYSGDGNVVSYNLEDVEPVEFYDSFTLVSGARLLGITPNLLESGDMYHAISFGNPLEWKVFNGTWKTIVTYSGTEWLSLSGSVYVPAQSFLSGLENAVADPTNRMTTANLSMITSSQFYAGGGLSLGPETELRFSACFASNDPPSLGIEGYFIYYEGALEGGGYAVYPDGCNVEPGFIWRPSSLPVGWSYREALPMVSGAYFIRLDNISSESVLRDRARIEDVRLYIARGASSGEVEVYDIEMVDNQSLDLSWTQKYTDVNLFKTYGLQTTYTWEEQIPQNAGPGRRMFSAGIFDPIGNQMLIWGGQDGDMNSYNDLWSYSVVSKTWAELTTIGDIPPSLISVSGTSYRVSPYKRAVAFYNSRDHTMILYHPDTGLYQYSIYQQSWLLISDTYLSNNSNVAGFTKRDKQVLLDNYYTRMYDKTLGTWSAAAPKYIEWNYERYGSVFLYDPKRKLFYLTGGRIDVQDLLLDCDTGGGGSA